MGDCRSFGSFFSRRLLCRLSRNRTAETYDADGLETGDTWSNTDGSHSAFVCAFLFVVPLIRRLSGRTDLEPRPESATLGIDLPEQPSQNRADLSVDHAHHFGYLAFQ